MLRTSYTWYDLETLCKMRHLKKNGRRVYFSMLKIILEQNDNFLQNGALVYQYFQYFDLLWFYFWVWTWTRLYASGHWKKVQLSPDLVHRWFIIYLFLNCMKTHTSWTGRENAHNHILLSLGRCIWEVNQVLMADRIEMEMLWYTIIRSP